MKLKSYQELARTPKIGESVQYFDGSKATVTLAILQYVMMNRDSYFPLDQIPECPDCEHFPKTGCPTCRRKDSLL